MKFCDLLTLASALAPSSFFGGQPQAQAPVAIAGHTFEPTQSVFSADKAPTDFVRMYNLTTTFFDNFMWPKNAKQAELVNSTFFAPSVLGRVDVTRNFNGQELNTEYAFGLFATIALNPDSFSLLGVPISYKIIHFAANQNIVSLALIIDFNITALGVVSPVEVDFWATYNDQDQISQYDATFRYLQWQFDWLYEVGRARLGLGSIAQVKDLVHQKLAESICTTAMDNCKGEHQQYESLEACFDFMYEEVPLGEAHQLGFSTVMCRMVHQSMVPLRPQTHCSHIGPTGGHYCTNDRTYVDNVREDLYTKAPFIPYGY